MSRLDETIHSALTSNILQKLHCKKIFTVLSFVQCNPETLTKISGLQYSQVLQVKKAILKKFSSPLTNGRAVYSEIISHTAILSTGIKNFDDLLDGGFITGNLYELCGSSSSGKTQICMSVAVNVCINLKQNVLYVDTKNDITAHRLCEIIESNTNKTESVAGIMNRIKITTIWKAIDLISFFTRLSKDLNEAEDKSLGFKIIIIDSLPPPFSRYMGNDRSEGLALLNNLANVLHYIAVEFHIVVLITNLVTMWIVDNTGNEYEGECTTAERIETPVMGKYWEHVPNTRVQVKKVENTDKWSLIILKSRNQAEGNATEITITKMGAVQP